MLKSPRTLLAVVPVFNEGEGLQRFNDSLWLQNEAFMACGWELGVLYVDDGSTDDTPKVLAQISRDNPHVRFLRLTRNFGHQAALCAGLERADADAVVVLDGDGQHPVDLIPEMLRLHISGSEIVRTTRVNDQNSGARLKQWASGRFHGLWGHLTDVKVPPRATEFALFGRPVLKALQQFHEVHRYLRGLLTLVGFKTTTLAVPIRPRQHSTTKYSLRKQLRLASDAVFSFSTLPLRLGLLPGLLFILVALLEAVVTIRSLLAGIPIVPGWTSLMLVVTLGFGCTMVLLALVGIYVGKIFEQVKDRPIYFIKSENLHTQGPGQSTEFLESYPETGHHTDEPAPHPL